MKGKTKLRVIQILCIVSLLITAFSVQKTYAKYFEKVNTTYATHIKRWVINVNDINIHRKEQLNQVMMPVLIENEHMNSNNTLVPGREGYFQFVINYASVDLAFQYDFDFEQVNATPLEDFEIYGFQIIDGENTTTIEGITDPSDISAIIDPVANTITLENPPEGFNSNLDTDKDVEIRALFRWNDDNADTTDDESADGMNNYEDTQFTGEANGEDLHKLLKYNVKITFTQYIAPSI